MDRETFVRTYRIATWILIIGSFFFNLPLIAIIGIFVLIFARGPITNKIYGPHQQPQSTQNNLGEVYPQQQRKGQGRPQCLDCGSLNPRGAKFCQDCGTPFDREQEIPYDEFR